MTVNVTDARREAAEQITEFLRLLGAVDERHARRVGNIATKDCPIRPPSGDTWLIKGLPGYEPHCQRVTSALDAAARLGLVAKLKLVNPRTRKPSGPWHYYAPSGASEGDDAM